MSESNELENTLLIFEQGKDPGLGALRVVGNVDKMTTVESDREISFVELYEVIFAKGRSTFLEEYIEVKKKGEKEFQERQFRIVGLTNAGRPILVVLTARDNGFAKRVITAWQVSTASEEYKKLITDCPHLNKEFKS